MLSVIMLSVVMLSVVYAGCLVFDEKRPPSANKVVSDVYANIGNIATHPTIKQNR